jgi:hypothetical protein
MAFWIAAVSLLLPSPFAPYRRASQTFGAASAGSTDAIVKISVVICLKQRPIFIESPRP